MIHKTILSRGTIRVDRLAGAVREVRNTLRKGTVVGRSAASIIDEHREISDLEAEYIEYTSPATTKIS